jgi:nicotinate-nucleotide adenylyltransferase
VTDGATGILGGTFDPVHNGHLVAARQLREVAALGEVWLMPNAQPPHRTPPAAGAPDRMRMVELAADALPGLRASALEVARGGVSYTIDTVRELARSYPARRFELLLGTDAALTIRRWHDAGSLLDEASFTIFNRPETVTTPDALYALGFPRQRTRLVHLDTPTIAAHEVRERLRQGLPIDGLVPPRVADYIRQHGLYRD